MHGLEKSIFFFLIQNFFHVLMIACDRNYIYNNLEKNYQQKVDEVQSLTHITWKFRDTLKRLDSTVQVVILCNTISFLMSLDKHND